MAREIVAGDYEKVQELTLQVLGTKNFQNFARMGGLTNHTYKVTLDNGEIYVVRLPGEGTEELINRMDEKVSTELACSLGIDARMLHFADNGSKVTEFVPNAKTMSPETMRDASVIPMAAEVLRTLHTCGQDTHVPFEVFEMADAYEKIIRDNHVPMYEDYDTVKNQVMRIKQKIDSHGTCSLVPCHNDPLCENWVMGNGKLYLIDWEYAGMNDGMWDVADVSIEADYTPDMDELLLNAYLKHTPTKQERERFIANKLYLDYLWTLWGKTRVPFDGDEMEQYALARYLRLKKNINTFMEGEN